jgi:hypothetical protein
MTKWLITVKPSYVYGFRICTYWSNVCYNSIEDRKPLKGNTVGSRLSIEMAYIAGFLDGDGSIMLQLKKRSDTSRGYRFMATICLYQDSRHDETLFWIRDVLGIGYISRRNDSISELRINGFKQVHKILKQLEPYIRFKRVQAVTMIEACSILEKVKLSKLSNEQLSILADLMIVIQNENYKASRKKTKEEIINILGLTP